MTTQPKMTGFEYEVQIADCVEATITWDKTSQRLSVHGITTHALAHKVFEHITNGDAMRDALQKLRDELRKVDIPREPGGVMRPAPYNGRPPTPPDVVNTAAPPAPGAAVVDEKAHATKQAQTTPPPAAQKRTPTTMGFAEEIPADDPLRAVADAVKNSPPPELAPEDRAKLAEMAKRVEAKAKQRTVAKIEAELAKDPTPTKPTPKPTPKPKPAEPVAPTQSIGMDPKAALEMYRKQAEESKKAKKAKKAKKGDKFGRGQHYAGLEIINSGVETTHHGDVYSLTLANGDAVLVSVDTEQELEYAAATPVDKLPEWAEPEAAAVTEAAAATEAAPEPTPEPMAEPTPEPAPAGEAPADEDLVKMKLGALVKLYANKPEHVDGVDVAVMTQQLWALKGKVEALGGCRTEEKLRKRIEGAINILALPVKVRK